MWHFCLVFSRLTHAETSLLQVGNCFFLVQSGFQLINFSKQGPKKWVLVIKLQAVIEQVESFLVVFCLIQSILCLVLQQREIIGVLLEIR
jgi:hypothetical protein